MGLRYCSECRMATAGMAAVASQRLSPALRCLKRCLLSFRYASDAVYVPDKPPIQGKGNNNFNSSYIHIDGSKVVLGFFFFSVFFAESSLRRREVET